MRYLSIDIETTGLNPDTCQILSIAGILEDTENPLDFDEIPKFHFYIHNHDGIKGEPYAIILNHGIIKHTYENVFKNNEASKSIITLNMLSTKIRNFLVDNEVYNENITLAGKNLQAFDLKFLEKHTDFMDNIKFHHRILDPASLYFQKDDRELPSLDKCLERAMINDVVKHDALSDAWDVIRVLRVKLNELDRTLYQRVNLESTKYDSTQSAALDHLRMAHSHLFEEFIGKDVDGLLTDINDTIIKLNKY